ncbi:thiamine-phosphate kinase, partial [Patescibacteria group bacterium]|nr:thiamine-phosphate kinase [Patescibacteria group bacterium]
MHLDEFSLIKKLTGKLPISSKNIIKGVGDDAAVIKISKNKYLLAACDILVENVHFLMEISKPEEIGQQAVIVNISDIAAMGGKPTFCLVSLIIPNGCHSERSEESKELPKQVRHDIGTDYIDRLYSGIIKECKKYNIQIIGGNISSGNQLVIDLFMLGEVKPD